MRLYVHDFGGYAFPFALSRALAARGHTVRHAWCASLQTTPPGAEGQAAVPGLTLAGLDLGRPLAKYQFATRWRQERAYGRLAARDLSAFRPDAVLSGNTPLDAQARLLAAAHRCGARFAFWLQDLIGVAAERLLREKVPVAGAAVGRYYLRLEQRLLRRSDAVVAITDDFRPLLSRWGVAPGRVAVVENWAPLAELPVRPPANAWAAAHGLDATVNLVYTGTLGLKHDPALLLALARHLADRPAVRVVVVSQGLGADWLRRHGAGQPNLVVLPYQPRAALPDVLGAAAVLLAVLEPEAGVFSVPSKVLTYLCAGRPLLLAVPSENLAARLVVREGAGRVVPPGDADALTAAAAALLADADARAEMGRRARAYAERAFDVARLADAFEAILSPR